MRGGLGALTLALCGALLGAGLLPGCTGHVPQSPAERAENERAPKLAASSAERNCLIRAMYFESNRSSRDGLLAVGTVVMNRVASPHYPDTICGVVAQPRQFAPGVLTRPLDPKELPLVERTADAVLKGERYAPVGNAMHFHVAGLQIPYRVRYVATAGGNSFYLKTGQPARPAPHVILAAANATPESNEASATAPSQSLFERLYASLAATPTAANCAISGSAFAPGQECH
ncbi:MAG TPA: cell wall hydrolase [Methyloceanibacter sp.]|nr:cell wall hydrolase [Methyloceanibacter sp.]